jgi:hypothetical protein
MMAFALLLLGSVPAFAQAGDTSGLTGPAADVPIPSYESYAGRPEAVSCLDVGIQADAQAILRADPSDPMQLDSDHNGIACEANPAPRDMNPVRR